MAEEHITREEINAKDTQEYKIQQNVLKYLFSYKYQMKFLMFNLKFFQ